MTGALSQRDIDSVLATAEALVSADSLDGLRQETVNRLPSLVPATSVSWNDVDLAHERMDVVTDPAAAGTVNEESIQAFLTHVADHPVISHYQRTNDGRPYAISDFLSESTFHATGLYRHLYRALRTEDQLSFVLPDPFAIIGVALNRDRRGFSEREHLLCNLLRPHVVQAYRQMVARQAVRDILDATTTTETDDQVGIVVVDADRRIETMSAEAERLLVEYFGPMRRAAALPEDLGSWLGPTTNPVAAGWPFVRRGGSASLAVRRVPVGGGTALFLSERPADPVPMLLQKMGLTAREAEVMGVVAGGLASKQVAARLAISVATVDKHVFNALRKLGVRTRLEAAALMSEGLRDAQRKAAFER